uniref:Uncharacterized protein n=1 Tax=Stegastes partitus TaxID=144197 RepID=A0A3B5B5D7_9TELE
KKLVNPFLIKRSHVKQAFEWKNRAMLHHIVTTETLEKYSLHCKSQFMFGCTIPYFIFALKLDTELKDIKPKVRLTMSKSVSGGQSEDESGLEKVQRPRRRGGKNIASVCFE